MSVSNESNVDAPSSVVLVQKDGKLVFYQGESSEKQPLESAVAGDFNSSAPQMGTVSLRG
jgi:hypothetical protein